MRGIVLNAHGENRYTVELQKDHSAAERQSDALRARIAEFDAQIETLEEHREGAVTAATEANDAVTSLVEAYQLCLESAVDADAINACESGYAEKIEAANVKAIAVAGAVVTWDHEIARVKTQRLTAQKRLGELEQISEINDVATVEAAHYLPAENQLDPGASVKVARAPGDGTEYLIVLDEDETDACLYDSRTLPPRVLVVDSAIESGIERWRPRYRAGIITAIDTDAGTATVRLAPARAETKLGVNHKASIPRDVDLNPKDDLLTEVPFGHCTASAYEVGDAVLLRFPARTWESAEVYGWTSSAKACANGAVYVVDYAGKRSASCSGDMLDVDAYFGQFYWADPDRKKLLSWDANRYAYIAGERLPTFGYVFAAAAIVTAHDRDWVVTVQDQLVWNVDHYDHVINVRVREPYETGGGVLIATGAFPTDPVFAEHYGSGRLSINPDGDRLACLTTCRRPDDPIEGIADELQPPVTFAGGMVFDCAIPSFPDPPVESATELSWVKRLDLVITTPYLQFIALTSFEFVTHATWDGPNIVPMTAKVTREYSNTLHTERVIECTGTGRIGESNSVGGFDCYEGCISMKRTDSSLGEMSDRVWIEMSGDPKRYYVTDVSLAPTSVDIWIRESALWDVDVCGDGAPAYHPLPDWPTEPTIETGYYGFSVGYRRKYGLHLDSKLAHPPVLGLNREYYSDGGLDTYQVCTDPDTSFFIDGELVGKIANKGTQTSLGNINLDYPTAWWPDDFTYSEAGAFGSTPESAIDAMYDVMGVLWQGAFSSPYVADPCPAIALSLISDSPNPDLTLKATSLLIGGLSVSSGLSLIAPGYYE